MRRWLRRLNCIRRGDWLAVLVIVAPIIVGGILLIFAR